MLRQSIQRIQAMLLCMVCLLTLSIRRSKHANALNAMFVETVDAQVFVALIQHPIQSTMRYENSTLLCIKWPLAPRYRTHPHVSAHNFLNIQLIFNPQKVLGKLRLRAFQPYHQYYICQYCQYRTRISNAFNAIYINTVDTKPHPHISAHNFLNIQLIFNPAKSFGKLRLRAFQPYHHYYICQYCRY